jgi:hypothetical protein
MQLEQQSREGRWRGTVPNALDGRVLGAVVVTAALAASVNVPYGGLPLGIVAFAVLAGSGVVVHVLGARKLRRITDGLVERWTDAGGRIEDVTKTSDGMGTEWAVHTPEGTIRIGGVALVPFSRLSVEWQGVGDTMDAGEAEAELDRVADSLFEEIFEIGSASQRS